MKKKGVLLGFKRGTGAKSGNKYCILHVAMPFEERDLQKGACGSAGEEIFCPANQTDYVQQSDIGKEIEIEYVISNGKLFVDCITVIRK